MQVCQVETCDRQSHARGLCKGHYQRAMRLGSPGSTPIAVRNQPFEERLAASVQITGFCWLWTGRVDNNGYGAGPGSRGAARRAYTWVYSRLVGPIPDGLELDHLCRVLLCVNPDHLEPVTHAENVRRTRGFRARRTHCPQGHAYLGDNLLVRSDGLRRCRTCDAEHKRRHRHLRRVAREENGSATD